MDSGQFALVRITAPAVATALEGLRVTLPTVAEGNQVLGWVADGQLILAAGEKIYEAVSARKNPRTGDKGVALDSLLPELTAALSEAESSIRGLEGDATERARVLSEQRSKASLLDAHLRLAQLLPDIRVHVANARWADSLRTLLGRFQGVAHPGPLDILADKHVPQSREESHRLCWRVLLEPRGH